MPDQFKEGIGKTFHTIFKKSVDQKIDPHFKKLLRDVNTDVHDHIDYRRPAIKHAEEAIQGYMALQTAWKPGRSSFFPPTLHAIVYSRMALESANMPDVQYKHRLPDSEPIMKFINAAREQAERGNGDIRPPSIFNWYLQNFDKLLFGVGFRHLTYLLQARVINIKDPTTGKWKEKYCVEYDDIWDEKLSFFYTGVSRDTLPGMFGGTSAHTDKFFRREQFLARHKDNPNYFNIELAMEKLRGEFIRVRYYWNLPLDLFCVQAMEAETEMIDDAGDGIIIREDHILEYGPEHRPQKMIPITSIHGDFNFDMKVASYLDLTLMTNQGRAFTDFVSPSRNQTFWTKGNAQLVKGVIAAKRALWRATMDNMKASTIFFAMSQNPGVLNQIKRSDLYGVVPMKADERSFNVKALLERPQAFNGITEYDEAVDNLGAFALGHDWRTNAQELTNQPATVAAIAEHKSNQRAAQNQAMNEAGGITRHYELLINLIQQFYTEKTMIKLLSGDNVPEGTDEKDIVRDKDGIIGYKREKQIPYSEALEFTYDKDGKPKTAKKSLKGSKLIPGKKELLVTDEKPEIYIVPNSTFSKNKAMERAQDNERNQALQFFAGLAYPDDKGKPGPDGQIPMKPLIPKEGMAYRLRKSAEVWGDDPDKLLGTDEEKSQQEETKIAPPFAHAKAQNSAKAALAGMPQGGVPGIAGQQPGQPQTPQMTLPTQPTGAKPMGAPGGLAGMATPGL